MYNKKYFQAYLGLSVLILAILLVITQFNPSILLANTTDQLNQTPDGAGNDFVSSEVMSTAADSGFVWTAEEMANARPYPMPTVDEAALTIAEAPVPDGPPQGIAGGTGAQTWSDTADILTFAAQAETLEALLAPAAAAPPFTRYRNIDSYKRYPYRAIGKIFFRQEGSTFVCSGAVVGLNIVWTAGHCVSDGNGTWSTDVIFVPGYKNGNTPYGVWEAYTVTANGAWHNNSNHAYDMGIIVLNKNNGFNIANEVGWLGFAWNLPRAQSWFQIGYPASSPFDGAFQQICVSSYARLDSSLTPATSGAGCDMTGGSSGGPWIYRFGTGNFVGGNVSYGRNDDPRVIYSPYFNNKAKGLYDYANGITPP